MSGLNIADIFETVVATAPDNLSLVVRTGDGRNECRFTAAELDARVNQLAHALLDLGVETGDHVGCHLYDGNQYVEVVLASYKVRAVPVNVNFRYVASELRPWKYRNTDCRMPAFSRRPNSSAYSASAMSRAAPLGSMASADRYIAGRNSRTK